MIKILTIILFLLLSLITFSQSAEAHWIEDIDFYKSQLEKKHIDLYNKINKTAFEKEIQKIKTDVQSKNDLAIIIDLMRLTRKIGDGHTAFSLRGLETHLFPFEIYKVEGNWRVIKVAKEYQHLLGKILTEIDGEKIEKISKEVSKVAQYIENKQSKVIRTGNYLMIPELLFGLNFTENKFKASFTFLDDISGVKTNISLNVVSHKDYYDNTKFESLQTTIPQVQKPTDAKHDYLWFSTIKATKGVYIKFESYPSFEDMEQFGALVLKFINENDIKKWLLI